MNTVPDIYTEPFTVRYYEVNPFGNTSIATICSLFQGVAFNSALEITRLTSGESSFSRAVVVTRQKVVMDHLPTWGDEITISTWLSPFKIGGRFFERNYLVRDETGKRIGAGLATGIVFDVEERRWIPIPDDFAVHPSRPKEDNLLEFNKIPRLSTVDFSLELESRFSDLDRYVHVNNVNYINWVVDSAPVEITENWQCYEVSVQFKRELKMGDIVTVQTEITERGELLRMNHAIMRKDDSKEAAILTTSWRAEK